MKDLDVIIIPDDSSRGCILEFDLGINSIISIIHKI